ncbi:MAG TPA: tetratricopeptide repeat protein [Vicinamibacteria bacterium]|jgi:cytochrome c-type biogenesis protein CcmH/NrfG
MSAVPLHLCFARGLRQLGLLTLAVEAYHDAVEADPACFEGWFAMGEVLARDRRWEAAIEAFHTAAALRPADVEAQGNLVLALYRSGKRCDAAAAMRRLIDLRPGQPELYLVLGAIQCRTRRPWEAIRTLRWAAHLAVPATTKRFLLGETLFGERQWRETLGHLDAVRTPAVLPASAGRGRKARAGVAPRRKTLAAILQARVRPPMALSAALCGLAAFGHLLVARAFVGRQPHLAIRSLRAARRLGAA